MVAVTPDRLCHGVLDCHTLIRDEGSLGADKDRQRSIEWIYVADREADIYDIYAAYLRRKGEGEASGGFVVRSQHDRLLVGGEKL
jgi:hypothetical protein